MLVYHQCWEHSIINAILDFAKRHRSKSIITVEGIPEGQEEAGGYGGDEDEEMDRDEILVSSPSLLPLFSLSSPSLLPLFSLSPMPHICE